jgi:hypothetical protein
MKYVALLALVFACAGCMQTANNGSSQMALASASSTPADVEPAPADAAVQAQPVAENLPPIYEPLVDMHRVNKTKYARDLATCREEAAPQERAARAAAEREATGTAMNAIGTVASFLPGNTWQAQRAINAASGTAQVVGASVATEGAVTGANATADYALVVNTCLQHRGYRLLRV